MLTLQRIWHDYLLFLKGVFEYVICEAIHEYHCIFLGLRCLLLRGDTHPSLLYFLSTLCPQNPQLSAAMLHALVTAFLRAICQVFKFCTVQKVLNASISVVEAYPLAGSNNLANNERQEGKGGAKEGEEQDSQADTCQLASDALSSLGTEDGKKGQGNEGGKVEGLEEEFIFQARSLNDVAHLQASGLVTSRSTAL